MFSKERLASVSFLVVVTLLVLLVLLALRADRVQLSPVRAESAGGVFAFTGESLGAGRNRLYLVDTKREQICVYDVINGHLRLIAARRYTYDVQVSDSIKLPGFGIGNTEAGTYDKVREVVVEQAH